MKTALIIGAGPAGLTAAFELLEKTDILPIILESSEQAGGLAKTIEYKGNRMDLGPHRFFSKSDLVMNWWQQMLPIDSSEDDITISYHHQRAVVHPSHHIADKDQVMLVKNRLTRIFFLGKFFDYPITLNRKTLSQLGFWRICKIGYGYLKARLFPIKPEETLEDFFINRFGKELYRTFFKDYTEKVWGVPTNQLSASWGAQRIKSLSLFKTIKHALLKKNKTGLEQKNTETSLVEKFLYPKKGAGQMWETTAEKILRKGGKIIYNSAVIQIEHNEKKVFSVTAANGQHYTADYFISTMPVRDLVMAMQIKEEEVNHIARNLVYRDFITVGVLLSKLKITNSDGSPIGDNWIYMQENKVKIGRLQIFNNWSNLMIRDPGTIWLGLEYFCNTGDALWNRSDDQMKELAVSELVSAGMIDAADVLDAVVVKVPKTYPSYTGVYDQINTLTNHLNRYENLFLIGRNGMHKYNNQDHSMLTAMKAVELIKKGITDKTSIWEINTEEDYHEEK
jgi:protoporphyrinogen oxidase